MSKNVPEIRFEGFSDEWEEKKLSSILKVNSGRDYKYLGKGNIPVYGTGGYMLSVDDKLSDEDSIGLGRKGTINKPQYLIAPFWTVDTLFFIKPFNRNDIRFLFSLIEKINWLKFDESTGVPSLSKTVIENVKQSIPLAREQNEIGNFFKQLDDRITIASQELARLKETKQGFLQKMFPKEGEIVPKIRFDGFDEEWINYYLLDVAEYKNGKAHENDIDEKGEYVVINSKFVSTNGKIRKYSNHLIEPMNKNDIAFVLSDVPNGRAIARTYIVKKNMVYSLNQRVAGIKPKEITHPYFLFVLMNRHHYFLRFDNGVGQTNLSKGDVEKFHERYPSLKEQTSIGNFFKKLDETIALQQKELELLKETKKAFLQKMFV